MKTVYFILGMHRSGTSAFTGTLNRLGLDIGNDIMPTTEDNPKGYYENNKVLHLNEKILSDCDSNWDDCHFKALDISKENQSKYVEDAKKIIKEEFRYSKQFCIKDPRNCLTFQIWEQASLELRLKIKIIIPYRNPIEVASSLKKRDSFSFEKSLVLWSHHFLSAELFSRPYDRIFVSFNELLNETKKTINKVSEFVSVKTNVKKLKLIENFLDSNIKHNYFSLENITIEIPGFLQKLFGLLTEPEFSNTELIDDIRKDFYYSLEMFQFNEVMNGIKNERDKDSEIVKLKEHIELLENISEIGYLDTKYYEEMNPDLSGYSNIELEQHYFEYGKEEGRAPNKYCEVLKINVSAKESNQEIIYIKNNQIDRLLTEALSNNNKIDELIKEKASLEDIRHHDEKQIELEQKTTTSLNNKLKYSLKEFKSLKKQLLLSEQSFSQYKEKQENELRNKNDDLVSLGKKLKSSSDNISVLEKQIKAKEDDLEDMDKKLKSCLVNISAYKKKLNAKEHELVNSNKKLKSCLVTISTYKKQLKSKEDKLLSTNKKLTSCLDALPTIEKQLEIKDEELKSINELHEDLINKKVLLEKQLAESNQNLEQSNNTIIINTQKLKALEEQCINLSERLQTEIKKYSELDIQFNDAIEEIARIKECACWVYTRPIRILKEKMTKGK